MTKDEPQRRRWTFYEAVTLKKTRLYFRLSQSIKNSLRCPAGHARNSGNLFNSGGFDPFQTPKMLK